MISIGIPLNNNNNNSSEALQHLCRTYTFMPCDSNTITKLDCFQEISWQIDMSLDVCASHSV